MFISSLCHNNTKNVSFYKGLHVDFFCSTNCDVETDYENPYLATGKKK